MSEANVHWIDPGRDMAPVVHTCTKEEAIARAKKSAESVRGPGFYGTMDQVALQDFLVVHWGWLSPDCVHHDNNKGTCTLNRRAPRDCSSCASQLSLSKRA